MMVVNASNQPGIFYQKTVNVCENTVYEFSADIINMLENHLSHLIQPNIAFIIDGQVVCETGDISADEQWHTYRFSFATAQGQSSVSLALRNNAPGGAGNDLALDNISFRACGPTIVVPSVRNYCRGATATISAGLENSPYATVYYQWQTNENGNWINIPGANAINLEIAFPENAQQYRLLVANSSFNLSEPNCRIASNPITLQQLPDLDLQMNTENVVCKGDSNGSASVQPLSGQSPYTYLWNTGATNSMISGLAPAQYSATIVDQLGCSGNISAAITEAEMALDLVLDSKNVSCQGASDGSLAATITGGVAPFSILWNTGQSIDSLEKLLPGNYKITITDANQCMITDSIEVSVGETPAAILTGELEIELGDIIEAKVTSDFDKATIENYTWIAGDLVSDCQECDQYSFQPTGDGCLQVIIEDYRGCIATDSICYKAIPKNRVFVPNVFSPNDDGKNDWFSLFSDNSVEQVLLFTVYDRWGAIVYQKDSLQPNDETSGWDGTSNGKYCENGVYIWVAEVMFINNQKNTYNGDVTLIR
jgi:gliding motility-associated-like protein